MVQEFERERIKEYLRSGLNSIDIGCGKHKMGEYGVDINPNSDAEDISDMNSLNFVNEEFDIAIMCHSLEHTDFVIESLGEVRRVLKKGGKLLIAVPNGDYVNSKDLGDSEMTHRQIFTDMTLRKILEYCKFKVNLIELREKAIFVEAEK